MWRGDKKLLFIQNPKYKVAVMQSISSMFIENLFCSLLLDSGKGIEAYKSSHWNEYFKFVKPIQEGNNSTKPNKQNLSVWRDGRGSFSDVESGGYFIDIKGSSSKSKLEGKKIELWAGRADGKKSQNYKWDSLSDEEITTEIIKEYHENKVGLQIHETLNDTNRPYIVGLVYPVLDDNGKITPMCQLVNVTKLWKHAGESDNAIGRKFFILRKKAVYNKVGRTVVSTSYVCRVEVKFKKQDAFAHLASMGAITKEFPWYDIEKNIKSIL